MSETPKLGDKVRLTIEGEVGDRASFDAFTFKGTYINRPKFSELEILERADDPANDPVGTVRRHPYRDDVHVKTAAPDYPWKSLHIGCSYYGLSGNSNETMRGAPIVGVVPWLVVWNADDDEPPRDGKYQDRYGDVWQYGVAGSGAVGWYCGFSALSWRYITENYGGYFPWKRVA